MRKILLIAITFILGSTTVASKVTACSFEGIGESEEELVNKSSLVIVGTPKSEVKEVPVTDKGKGLPLPDFSNYYQEVQVEEVLKGEVPSSPVTVLTWGKSEAGKKKGTVSSCSSIIPDRILKGKQILFLSPLPEQPSVFTITGFFAGDLELDSSGKVKPTQKGFDPFNGLALSEVKQKVKQLSK